MDLKTSYGQILANDPSVGGGVEFASDYMVLSSDDRSKEDDENLSL